MSVNRVVVLFVKNFWDNSSIFLNVLQRRLGVVGAGINQSTYVVNPLRRFVSSGSPSTVVVVMFCLNLSSWGRSSSIFSLTSSHCCGRPCQFWKMANRLMSAFTPPRADLRGGNQPADSFATSRSIFAPSTTFCLFARRTRAVNGLAWSKAKEHTHNDLD